MRTPATRHARPVCKPADTKFMDPVPLCQIQCLLRAILYKEPYPCDCDFSGDSIFDIYF